MCLDVQESTMMRPGCTARTRGCKSAVYLLALAVLMATGYA